MENNKQQSLFSYVLRYDRGLAPNPYGGVCTLTLCKPVIRRVAQKGDWIVGTGSKRQGDVFGKVIYAMKVSEVMSMRDYNTHCQRELEVKIPVKNPKNWQEKAGDCIYDYSKGNEPQIRDGMHTRGDLKRDLSGLNALLSDDFYYFGQEAVDLPDNLKTIIKTGPGHKRIRLKDTIIEFEHWIRTQELNKGAEPCLKEASLKQECTDSCSDESCEGLSQTC